MSTYLGSVDILWRFGTAKEDHLAVLIRPVDQYLQ